MFFIDTMSRQPIYLQIVRQLEHFVLAGLIHPGDEMPSVRSLSLELCINPNTIQKAYGELIGRGLLFSVPGKGCFVSPGAEAILNRARMEKLDEIERTIQEFAMAGIDKQEVINRIERAYHTIQKGESQS